MDIVVWLPGPSGSLRRHFRENEIDETVLPKRGSTPAFASTAATDRSPVAEKSGSVRSDRRRWRELDTITLTETIEAIS
jgi:hypothetical protein